MTDFYLPKNEFRDQRRTPRVEKLLALRNEGFEVKQLTEYQFRINDRLDFFPTNDKWHDINTGERGEVRARTPEGVERHWWFEGGAAVTFIKSFFANLSIKQNE